ncbi:hypothetical protein [Methylobacterium sp. D48H]
MRVAFALDCCDREAMSYVATTAGITGEDVRDLMVAAVEHRFGYDAHDERVGRRLDADDGQAIGHERQDTAGHGVLRRADLRRWDTSRWPAHFATRSVEEPDFGAC